MPSSTAKNTPPTILPRDSFPQLIAALQNSGYQVIAPVARDNSIMLDEIDSFEQLPVGKSDQQEAGSYRLSERSDNLLFGYVVGAQSWKKYLFPSQQQLFTARKDKNYWTIEREIDHKNVKYAFLGARPCDIHAIGILDKIFQEGDHPEPGYIDRRKRNLVVAVNCTVVGGNCFCASMGTGPRVKEGYDLALTEVVADSRHYFLLEAGSKKGKDIADKIGCVQATESEIKAADAVMLKAEQSMGRKLDLEGVKELLYRNFDNPRWRRIAERCLSCGNCTMVCPTCFCSTIEDGTDLKGGYAERNRLWDSCYSMDHSYIHGGSVRYTPDARYRQWLTHKFASWSDQFGLSGCVGCGRCITWCPVGIDVTEEIKAIAETDIELTSKKL